MILLIDGVHRQRLPVWHKEIPAILKDGCQFVGCSSIGAFRAVECELWCVFFTEIKIAGYLCFP